jgi:hypothetical protein
MYDEEWEGREVVEKYDDEKKSREVMGNGGRGLMGNGEGEIFGGRV